VGKKEDFNFSINYSFFALTAHSVLQLALLGSGCISAVALFAMNCIMLRRRAPPIVRGQPGNADEQAPLGGEVAVGDDFI
jgi:hypothetical protein